MVDSSLGRYRATLVRLAVALLTLVAAFPWQTFDLLGLGVALAWATLAALVLSVELSAGLILTATSTLGFMLAYSSGLGDAVAEGVIQNGVTASPEGSLGAVSGLALFLVVLAAVADFVRRLGRRVLRPRREPPERRPDVAIAVVLCLAVCLVAAIDAGNWTQWTGEREAPSSGGLRLELVYPASLLAAWAYGTLGWLDGTLGVRRRWLLTVAGAVTATLLFIQQSRRLMIAAALLTALAQLLGTRHRTLRAAAPKLAATVAVLAVFTLASSGWRSAADEEALTMGDRFARALGAVSDPKSLEGFESRLTYLWFDAMTHDLSSSHGAEVDGGELLLSAVVTAIPRSLFEAKADFDQVTCEAGVEGFAGMDVDLPCTPAGEGWLMWGVLGVLFAGALWGLTLGIAEVCVERGPGLARVFGLYLFNQFILVETGVFASVTALRLGLIGLAGVALIAAVTRLGTRAR